MKTVFKSKTDKYISVCININGKAEEIAEKVYEEYEIELGGYGWETIVNYWLPINHPELYEGLENDPEGSMYAAYYKNTDENDKKADKLIEVIEGLLQNPQIIYNIIEEKGDELEWD